MVKVKRFTASWCSPCKQLAPLFAQLQTSFPNVQFETIDVDVSPNETSNNMITSVPTVVFFKDGVPKQRFSGVQSKSIYVDTINSLI